MKKTLISITIIILTAITSSGQEKLLTVAESSAFKSTSNYNDVMSFIEKLKKSSPYIRVENIAKSTDDREIPLLIIGNPLPASPADMKNDKRIVVYIQANIHAGEVEGKEASLMFARDILSNRKSPLFNNIVFLICPNFNPDGNEQISPLNRTYQNGPANGVGVRHNGQLLDLNRDAMKAESPEVRGVITNVFNRWDPSVFMDCHTTNGSYHVEPVTFTWMVNPNGDRNLINYMRDRMMPAMSESLRSDYKVENCFYGEFADMMAPEKGWYLDASEPRYMSNYFGLRNRLGILNENYVYSDYESRVKGCYYLIHSLAGYVAKHRDEIKDILRKADAKAITRGEDPSPADSFAIAYKAQPAPEKVTVMTYEAEEYTDENGRKRYRRSDRRADVTIPYYIDYYPTRSVTFPFAYLLTITDPLVTGLLKLHGIRIEKLAAPLKTEVEKFVITSLRPASRLNQGHYMNSVTGKYADEIAEFPAGTLVIRTAQPLANIAASLLEPESNDGLLVWNFLDRALVPQWGAGYNQYPVYKINKKTDLKTVPLK